MARPRRPIEEAREFGYLVEIERARSPKLFQHDWFARVFKRDQKRWGSTRTMNRLWSAYKEDRKQNPAEAAEWAWRRSVPPMSEEQRARRLTESRLRELVREQLRERRPDTGRLHDDD